MEKKMQKASRLDYTTLQDLARSRNIKCVEARGLDLRKGVRFQKDGTEWIAVDRDLPITEKTRTLGFLLENEPEDVAKKLDITAGDQTSPVLTLCC